MDDESQKTPGQGLSQEVPFGGQPEPEPQAQNPEALGQTPAQVDEKQIPPTKTPPPQGSLTTFQRPRPSFFRIFVVASIIIIIVVYAVVAYLYFQNRQIKNDSSDVTQETPQLQAPPEPETPAFSPEQIKIANGSVVREIPGGQTTILVKKEDYTSTGITGFARVVVSPTNTKMCFEAWPPAPEPALYVSEVDGSGIAEISPNRQNCVWKSDSSSIFYINTSAKTSTVNLYSFNLTEGVEKNLTASSVPEEGIVRRFEIVGFSADETKLICKYEDIADTGTTQGSCEVDLEKGVVALL